MIPRSELSMKRIRTRFTYLLGCFLLVMLGMLGLSLWVSMLRSEVRALNQDQARRNDTSLAPNAGALPGLGEYMTTMQLHVGKLWFAARANNWDLALYELDELREAMEAAQKLHATKNGVDVSKLLAAVVESQIIQANQAIDKKSQKDFTRAYDDTLNACNGCHEESGHRFIKIIRPVTPPVSNQRWAVAG